MITITLLLLLLKKKNIRYFLASIIIYINTTNVLHTYCGQFSQTDRALGGTSTFVSSAQPCLAHTALSPLPTPPAHLSTLAKPCCSCVDSAAHIPTGFITLPRCRPVCCQPSPTTADVIYTMLLHHLRYRRKHLLI